MTITETRTQAPGSRSVTDGSALPEPRGLAGWLTTTDHKRIGQSWVISALFLLVVAAGIGAVVGIERLQDGEDLIGARTVADLLHIHGTTLAWLVVAPLALGLATHVVPLQVGAANVAFPRGSAAAYWTWLLSGGLLLTGYGVGGGPAGTTETGVDLWLAGQFGVAAALAIGLVSVITTVVALRAPGMGLRETPFFSWSILTGGGLLLLSLAVLMADLTFLYVGHHFGGQLPAGSAVTGWALTVPGVFLLAVPAMGVAADVVPVFARVRQERPGVVLGLLGALAVLGFGAWAQLSEPTREPLLWATSALVLLPALGLLAGAADTLRRGRPRPGTPLVWALTAGLLLLLAALAGALAVIDPLELHGTAWLDGQRRLALGAALLGLLGGVVYWGPKMWGARVPEPLSGLAVLAVLGGVVLAAAADLVAGLVDDVAAGQPDLGSSDLAGALGVVGALGDVLLAVGALLILVAVLAAARTGRTRTTDADPWEGHTLEWATSSPPPPGNFPEPLAPVTSDRPLLDARTTTTEAPA